MKRYTQRHVSSLSLVKRSRSANSLAKRSYFSCRFPVLKPIGKGEDLRDHYVDEFANSGPLVNVLLHKEQSHIDLELPILPRLSTDTQYFDDDLFQRKIKLCCNICLFSDPNADIKAKEIKMHTLEEIANITRNPAIHRLFSELSIDLIFEMIIINLTQPSHPLSPTLYYMEDPQIEDVNWPHLEKVYNIISAYQLVSPYDYHFTVDFHNSLIHLLNSCDKRENERLVSILTQYYASFEDRRNMVLLEMQKLLFGYLYDGQFQFCLNPVLEFFYFHFSLPNALNPVATSIFENSIIPLLLSNHLSSIFQVMLNHLIHFSKFSPLYASYILCILLDHWPVSCPAKQICFLEFILSLIPFIPPKDFERLGKKIFRMVAECVVSPHTKIALTAFKLVTDATSLPIIVDQVREIYRILYRPLQWTSKMHWSLQVQNGALETLKAMRDTEPFAFDKIIASIPRKNSDYLEEIPERQRMWLVISRAAAKTDTSLDIGRVMMAVEEICRSQNENYPVRKKKFDSRIIHKL